MLIKLTGGRVYDPAHGVDGEVRDICVRDGVIVVADANARVDEEYAEEWFSMVERSTADGSLTWSSPTEVLAAARANG